jgi:hypothetical protein
MRKKKKKQSHPPPVKRGGKVPVDLIDLCFNCFATELVAKCCPNPSCYLHCCEPGHAAQYCRRPRFIPSDVRRRPTTPGRKRARPVTPPSHPSPDDFTPPALSCSTDGELDYPLSVALPLRPISGASSPAPSPPPPFRWGIRRGAPKWSSVSSMLGTELSRSSRGRMTLGVEKFFWFIFYNLSQCHALQGVEDTYL